MRLKKNYLKLIYRNQKGVYYGKKKRIRQRAGRHFK